MKRISLEELMRDDKGDAYDKQYHKIIKLIEHEKIKPVKSSGTNGKRPASHLENYIGDREFVLALDRYLRDGQGRYIPQEILNISDFTGKM